MVKDDDKARTMAEANAAIVAASQVEHHKQLSNGDRMAWLSGTVPIRKYKIRPVGTDGLEYADCLLCLVMHGLHYTLCRRVQCIVCKKALGELEGKTEYCSKQCQEADQGGDQ